MDWREIVNKHESVALNHHQSSDARKLAGETAQAIKMLRNELCIKCGKYMHAHIGKCDGCEWK